jgi:SAM-dependent methyltransferase
MMLGVRLVDRSLLTVRPWSKLPPRWKRRAIRAKHWAKRNRPGNRVRWGSFRRTTPVSRSFGLDRGLPVDRVYLADFIGRHRADLRGSVMEVSRRTYVDQFGTPDRVTIVDIDRTNTQATLHCDLSEEGSLPAGEFDCIVLTSTLQFLGDFDAALRNLWGALAPGGVLLITVPAVSRAQPVGTDHWRFTPVGLERALRDRLPTGAEITVEWYGNVFAAVATLHGLSVEETGRAALLERDPEYPVIVCARVVRNAVT